MPKDLEDRVIVYAKRGAVGSRPLDPEVDRVALRKFAEILQEEFGNQYGVCRDGERYDSCK
ncbi:MAG: hypothetical protein AABX31_05015 [Nanoarchaeota archaeon]